MINLVLLVNCALSGGVFGFLAGCLTNGLLNDVFNTKLVVLFAFLGGIIFAAIFFYQNGLNFNFSLQMLLKDHLFAQIILGLFILNIISRIFIQPFGYLKHRLKYPQSEDQGINLVPIEDLFFLLPLLFVSYRLAIGGFGGFIVFCGGLNLSLLSSFLCFLNIQMLKKYHHQYKNIDV